jgi:hypothetical protein
MPPPHVGYECDFQDVFLAAHDPNDVWVPMRNMETKQVLMSRYINTCSDLMATLTKR